QIDGAVAAFTALVSLATGMVFAAVPALPGRRDLAASLRDDGSRTSDGQGRGRLRSVLVVAQVALSVVLLVGAGLMLQSLLHLESEGGGMHPENVLTMRVDLDWSKMDAHGPRQQQLVNQAYDRILARVREVPGVADAALATTFPLAVSFPFSGHFDIE